MSTSLCWNACGEFNLLPSRRSFYLPRGDTNRYVRSFILFNQNVTWMWIRSGGPWFLWQHRWHWCSPVFVRVCILLIDVFFPLYSFCVYYYWLLSVSQNAPVGRQSSTPRLSRMWGILWKNNHQLCLRLCRNINRVVDIVPCIFLIWEQSSIAIVRGAR